MKWSEAKIYLWHSRYVRCALDVHANALDDTVCLLQPILFILVRKILIAHFIASRVLSLIEIDEENVKDTLCFYWIFSRLKGSTIEKLPASGLTGEAYLFTADCGCCCCSHWFSYNFFSGPATVTIEARHIKYILCVYLKHSRYIVLVLWLRQLLLFAIFCRHTHTRKTHT